MSLCWLPYKEVHLYVPSGAVMYCCKQDDKHYKLDDFSSGKDILFNEQLTKLKKDLYTGKKPDVCSSCWRAENLGSTSWRQQEGAIPHNYNNETTLLSNNVYVDHVNLYFDNTCDLACVYCNADFSSRWENELGRTQHSFAKFLTKSSVNHNIEIYNNRIAKVLDFLQQLGKYTKSDFLNITILGGEPLLSPQIKDGEFVKYLQAFLSNASKQFNLMLTLHTNANSPKKLLDRFITDFDIIKEQYPNVKLKVVLSIDTVGKPSEYIRYGSTWKNVSANIDTFLTHVDYVQFYPTFSLLNIPSFVNYLEWLETVYMKHSEPIQIRSGVVFEPDYLSPYILPSKYINRAIDKCIKLQHIFNKNDYQLLLHRLYDIKNNAKTNQRSLDKLKLYFDYIQTTRQQNYVDYLGNIL